jgi:hypothetical protein
MILIRRLFSYVPVRKKDSPSQRHREKREEKYDGRIINGFIPL